jgi:hypothetical protein
MRPAGLAIALSGVPIAVTSVAAAQVRQLHWDLGAEVGVTDRVAIGGGAPARLPGPSGEIHAHVALYPMIRVGPYAVFDLSPTEGLAARRVYGGGLRAKITPPWLATPWRAWGFVGFGLAYAYAPSSSASAAGSAILPEVPIGIGLGHKLRGLWEACVEVGARWNLAGFGGAGAGAAAAQGATGASAPFVGNDLLAVSLSLGVSLAE